MKKILFSILLILVISFYAYSTGSAGTTTSAEVLISETGRAEQYSLAEYEKLTGSTIDSFSQSPLLDSRGLDPVEDRLPTDVAVVTPVEQIGEYGGTAYATAMARIGLGEGFSITGAEGLFCVAADIRTVVPNVANSYTMASDATSLTIKLRRGMKWSDGTDFTVEDFRFAYEDMMANTDVSPRPPGRYMMGGELMKMTVVDNNTIRYDFKTPAAHILSYMALLDGDLLFRPAHYLKQFHADYADKAALEKKVKEAGFDTWVQLILDQNRKASGRDPYINLEFPSINAFVPIQTSATTSLFERNPFYWKVDPAGNQLPYMDYVQVNSVSNPEVYNVKILAGEVDYGGEYTDFSNYTLYTENAEAGNYRVLLWDQDASADTAFFPILTANDPVIAEMNQDKRFRIALSLAIDREAINKTLFFGRGEEGQATAVPPAPWYEESNRQAYAQYDPDEANRLLDEMGLKWDSKKEWRLRLDGKPLDYLVNSGPIGLVEKVTEMVLEDWAKIGIKTNFKVQDWGLTHSLHQAGDDHMMVFMVNTADAYSLFSGGNGLSWFDFSDGSRYFTSVMLPSYGSGEPFPAEFPDTKYPFSEIARLREVTGVLRQTLDMDKRVELLKDIFASQAENLWSIGTVVGKKPIIASNRLRNIPTTAIWGDGLKQGTAYHPEQYYLKQE